MTVLSRTQRKVLEEGEFCGGSKNFLLVLVSCLEPQESFTRIEYCVSQLLEMREEEGSESERGIQVESDS